MKLKKSLIELVNFQNMMLIVMIGVWIFLICMNLAKTDTYFSESENRILTQKPEIERETVLSGEYGKEYENYLNDQFIGRDQWISLKTNIEKTLGKQESNGVYFGKDGSLLEKHEVQEIDDTLVTRKIDKLVKQVAGLEGVIKGDVQIMMIPTADMIQSDKLPSHATVYNQYGFLEELDQGLGNSHMRIPVEEVLDNHKGEYIYYGTDHHWTTLGAFYAYQQWKGGNLSDYSREVVSDDFLGTLHAKVNISMKPDQIEIFRLKEEDSKKQVIVDYVYEDKVTDSFYEWSYLETKDQYGMFLDGNHPLIHIQVQEVGTGEQSLEETVEDELKNSILVVKNSYANCFIPFLVEDYTDIYVIDPRYNRSNLETFASENGIDDVLYLYDVINFIRNF